MSILKEKNDNDAAYQSIQEQQEATLKILDNITYQGNTKQTGTFYNIQEELNNTIHNILDNTQAKIDLYEKKIIREAIREYEQETRNYRHIPQLNKHRVRKLQNINALFRIGQYPVEYNIAAKTQYKHHRI